MAKRKTLSVEEIQRRVDRRRALLEKDIRRLAERKSTRLRELRAKLAGARREAAALAREVPRIDEQIRLLRERMERADAREREVKDEIPAIEAELAEEERRAGGVEVESI